MDELGKVFKKIKMGSKTPKDLMGNYFPLKRRAVLGIVQRVVSGEERK